MRILIGGSPSTGSSVFRQVLNRHPQVFCGPETNLFCYKSLYDRWRSGRHKLLRKGIFGLNRTDVRRIAGVFPDDPEFGWSLREIRALARAHDSFAAFADAFFSRPLANAGKIHWAEKTPANVMMFPVFTGAFEDSHLVHMFRNPYDTVASLAARGMTAFEAAAVYLLHTAHGLAARTLPGYCELKYESFTRDPEEALRTAVLEPFGLEYFPEMLSEGNNLMASPSRMPGWRSDETDSVSDQSVSRFEQASPEIRQAIATALWAIRITPKHASAHDLPCDTIEGICSELGYPFLNSADVINTGLLDSIKADRKRHRSRLARYRLVSEHTPFPIEIYSESE